jgi:Serine carboxypeptidase
MRKQATFTVFAVLIVILAGGAAPLRAQLQSEAGFIPVEGSVSYFQFGSYFNRLAMRTSPARIWYTFQPADEEAEGKPLFVFFNGGPGGATSCGLFSANTARLTVVRDEVTGEAAIVANPASWTRAGNLLHIDARTAGFSYSLMSGPGDEARRGREFDLQNYNPFVDGADFVRVLLRFLADHPSIRANRVVLVPESYGGIRTLVMLNLLLYYRRYAEGGSVYQDPGLVAAIQSHYDAVFAGYAGAAVPPAVVAGQFGHQVLIQTVVTTPFQTRVKVEMLEAPGSPLYQVAAETGIPYVPYAQSPGAVPNPTPSQVQNYIYGWLDAVGRDVYHMAKPANFFDGFRSAAREFLTQPDTLSFMTGVDVAGVAGMYASARADAYKTRAGGSGGGGSRALTAPASRLAGGVGERTAAGKLAPGAERAAAARAAKGSVAGRQKAVYDFSALVGPAPQAVELAAWLAAAAGESDMAAVFGALQPWDRYYVDLNYDITNAFAWNKATLRNYPLHFQSSPLYGRMFLENAAWAETFSTNAAWDSVVYTAAMPGALALHTDVLSNVQLDTAGPPGAARPGRIVLTYRPSTIPGSTVTTRTIRFPGYLLSGHAVTLTEPMEILDDVIEWLASTGVPARGR